MYLFSFLVSQYIVKSLFYFFNLSVYEDCHWDKLIMLLNHSLFCFKCDILITYMSYVLCWLVVSSYTFSRSPCTLLWLVEPLSSFAERHIDVSPSCLGKCSCRNWVILHWWFVYLLCFFSFCYFHFFLLCFVASGNDDWIIKTVLEHPQWYIGQQ